MNEIIAFLFKLWFGTLITREVVAIAKTGLQYVRSIKPREQREIRSEKIRWWWHHSEGLPAKYLIGCRMATRFRKNKYTEPYGTLNSNAIRMGIFYIESQTGGWGMGRGKKRDLEHEWNKQPRSSLPQAQEQDKRREQQGQRDRNANISYQPHSKG